MDDSVASSAEASASSSSTGRMLHLLDEHRMIVISLFLIAIANHAWAKRCERHRNERRSENRRRAVEEKRREAERIWGHSEAKATQPDDGVNPQKPQAMHGVANASSTVQHTETLAAGPSSSSGQVAAAIDRSRERRRRGRDVSKDVRRKGSKRSVAGSGKLSSAPDEQEPFLNATRSESQSSGTTSYGQRNPSCSSSAPRSAFDFEDETPRPGTSGRTPEHDLLEGQVALAMDPSSHVHEGDEVHPTIMHDRDITLKSSTSEYDVPESVHVFDTETRSSMSDSVSSLGISTHPSSNTSDNGDVSDLPMDSVGSHSARYEMATPPSPSKRSPSPSPVPTSSTDFAAETASTEFLHAMPIPISQPVPSHLKTQLPWLSESQPKKGQYSSLGSRTESHSKLPSSSSVESSSISDASSLAGWDNADSPIRNVLRSRSPPPRFRSRSRASASPMLIPSVSSTPALWTYGLETPPPNASLQTQVSAYRGALEAARQRELSIKKEVEAYKLECEKLKKEFQEECERRNGRESELQAQVQYFLNQLRNFPFSAMANAGTHPQMQHLPIPQHLIAQQNGFPYQTVPHSPFSYPSPYIPQHSQPISSPPAAAMPLPLPMNNSFPFAPAHYPPPRDGFRHLSAPTSNVASPTRETTFSALSLNGFDSPSLGGGLHSMYLDRMRSSMYGHTSYDGLSEQNGDENDSEYISPLEEAILKRPASMRSPSRASGSRSLSGGGSSAPASDPNSCVASRTGSSRGGSRSASVAGGATREGVFTFASLSELGNPQRRGSSPQKIDAPVSEGDEVQDLEGVNGVDYNMETTPSRHDAMEENPEGEEDSAIDSNGRRIQAMVSNQGLSSDSNEQTLDDSDTTPRTIDEDKPVT